MKRIEYKHHSELLIHVYLDGRKVGSIEKSKTGWIYYPVGQVFGGAPFKSLQACKDSLEAE